MKWLQNQHITHLIHARKFCKLLLTPKKNPQRAGNKILCNIQNTMSDRAVTELNFDEVLERYREELLPQIRADYNTMNDENRQYT